MCREETAPFCAALAKFRDMLRQTSLFDSLNTEKGEKPRGEEKFLLEQIDNLRKACMGCSSEQTGKIMAAICDFQWGSETDAKLEKIRVFCSSYQFEEALKEIELIGKP